MQHFVAGLPRSAYWGNGSSPRGDGSFMPTTIRRSGRTPWICGRRFVAARGRLDDRCAGPLQRRAGLISPGVGRRMATTVELSLPRLVAPGERLAHPYHGSLHREDGLATPVTARSIRTAIRRQQNPDRAGMRRLVLWRSKPWAACNERRSASQDVFPLRRSVAGIFPGSAPRA